MRLGQIINTDDAMKLLNHYYEVPNDLDIEYSSVFVKRAMILFDVYKNWKKDDLNAFVTLFKELQWTSEDQMEVLRRASNCRRMEVLEIFVNLVEIVLGRTRSDSNVNEKIDECCSQWLSRTVNMIKESHKHVRNNTQNNVCMTYRQLSIIYPIIADRPKVKNGLLKFVEEEIDHYGDELIYVAARDIGNLSGKDIEASFRKILRRRLAQPSCRADDILLKKIRLICGCDGKQIRVPNG